MPPRCQVATTEPPPHGIIFRLRNVGTTSPFLRFVEGRGCIPDISRISSCAGDFRDDVRGERLCDCQSGCPVGGPDCGPLVRAVVPGEIRETSWQASVAIPSSRNGQACATGLRHLPPGRYRMMVDVFATGDDALAAQPVRTTISQDFDLPIPGDTLDVPFAVDP